MRQQLIINASIFLAFWFGVCLKSHADCEYNNQPFSGAMPLQIANLTIGRDVPNGSVIYRQSFTTSTPVTLLCDGPFLSYANYTYINAPLSLSSWNTGQYAGHVYSTGVAGIGFVLTTPVPGVAWPFLFPGRSVIIKDCENLRSCIIDSKFLNAPQMEMLLIKTGDVSPGTIQGASLPTSQVSVDVSGIQYTFLQVGFSGAINIVSRTCETPNIQVNMGSHKVSELSGISSTTQWKKFNIVLRNCPAFLGSYPSVGPGWSSDGATKAGQRVGNSLTYRIDATNTLTEANRVKGILNINASAQGASMAAAGVGIQIGDGNGMPLPLAAFQASGVDLNSHEGASYSIPLMARYIQTNQNISAGPANASATFTLSYQ